MKKYVLFFVVLFISASISAQIVTIPDNYLKHRLTNTLCVDTNNDGIVDDDVDTNNDGEVQVSEALNVTYLDLTYDDINHFFLITGLEAFVNLKHLDFTNDYHINLDESVINSLLQLEYLNLYGPTDNFMNLENLVNLKYLDLTAAQIDIEGYGIDHLVNLEHLVIGWFVNTFSNVEISNLTNLKYLEFTNNSNIEVLTLNNLPNLETLICNSNDLISLDLTSCPGLKEVYCHNNPTLNSLNLNGLNDLEKLECYSSNLTTLDASNLVNLQQLHCSQNSINNIQLSGSNNLNYIDLDNNNIETINLNGLEQLNKIDIGYNALSNIDLNGLSQLNVLKVSDNELTEITLDGLVSLDTLYISNNSISATNFNGSPNLRALYNTNNDFNSIDLSPLTNLRILEIGGVNYTSIDFTSLNQLRDLSVLWGSNITNLEVSGLNILRTLTLRCENLNEIDLSELNNLRSIDALQTPLHSIDISDSPLCEDISASFNNQLRTLNVKNGGQMGYFGVFGCPNLEYVCIDDFEMDYVLTRINNWGYDCVVNSYCSFVSGGSYYTVEGTTHLDLDDNGCTIDDAVLSNLNFSITDGTETGNFISDSSENYTIPFQDGMHTVTPILENPDYFTITPTEILVSFPTDASPFLQDFCVTSNGTYNDLEITIIPLEVARPGFDASYKIVYKNKGTTQLSGDIDFGFQDEVMEFVSSSPANESGLTDLLHWGFIDLVPFESREIEVTMNLNSPMDTNPLNSGDFLTFITSISSSETDETPDDNTFELYQTVVNSYDPNDKTCLEGDFITPEMVGEYVHYMIRFENTGTADAINIVVKDDIDTSKYDLSSLVPLHASHNYVARIKDNATEHYVEFIFENINLPFDDTNNDGYIVFKIKTLDTLALNDTFENDAEIYFDFNFPIITNTESTTVGTLSTEEFEFDNSMSLYPNPTTDVLTLESQQAIKQVTIYDISGRLINEIAIISFKTEITFSTEELSAGTYFVKIKTETGEIVKKVIKE